MLLTRPRSLLGQWPVGSSWIPILLYVPPQSPLRHRRLEGFKSFLLVKSITRILLAIRLSIIRIRSYISSPLLSNYPEEHPRLVGHDAHLANLILSNPLRWSWKNPSYPLAVYMRLANNLLQLPIFCHQNVSMVQLS
jgi:hypothetical protein